jgi:hypothetical protein
MSRLNYKMVIIWLDDVRVRCFIHQSNLHIELYVEDTEPASPIFVGKVCKINDIDLDCIQPPGIPKFDFELFTSQQVSLQCIISIRTK